MTFLVFRSSFKGHLVITHLWGLGSDSGRVIVLMEHMTWPLLILSLSLDTSMYHILEQSLIYMWSQHLLLALLNSEMPSGEFSVDPPSLVRTRPKTFLPIPRLKFSQISPGAQFLSGPSGKFPSMSADFHLGRILTKEARRSLSCVTIYNHSVPWNLNPTCYVEALNSRSDPAQTPIKWWGGTRDPR